MIKAELSFDVSLCIYLYKCLFISTLHNLALHTICGEIKGDITKEGKKSVYTVSQSEIDENLRGVGLGYKFYVETIKKCFSYGCIEFRSSTSLNEMSVGIWESIVKNNYNASFVQRKKNPYYIVQIHDKFII